jgi:hypothetical protein
MRALIVAAMIVVWPGAAMANYTLVTHICYFGCHDEKTVFETQAECLAAIKHNEATYWKPDMPATHEHYRFECKGR